MPRTLYLSLLLLCGCGGSSGASVVVDSPASDATKAASAQPVAAKLPAASTSAPPLELTDVSGRTYRPFGDPPARAACLIFVLPDCPIANGYAPELARIMAEYAPQGVHFFVVHPDADVSAEKALQHAREFNLPAPVLLDHQHALVKRTGASHTPEAAVYVPSGELAYRGRIDNRYADFGQRRANPTTHDLREALDAILAGRAVKTPRTDVIGCPIPEPLPAKDPP